MIDPYLQSQYDNSGKIAGSAELVGRYPVQASAFRARHAHAEYALPYGSDPRQQLDIFWPGSGRDAPLALFIHGGYWQRGDRSQWSHVAAGLVTHGIAVAVPSYPICPAVSMTALVDAVRDVVPFLHHRHGKPVFVTGHSAGGHLAAMLLATDWAAYGLPADAISAAMPISGLFDLAPLRLTSINDALGMDAAEAHALSARFLPAPGRPFRAVVGGDEGPEYFQQSRGLADAWVGRWETLAGHHHFSIVDELADPASRLVAIAIELQHK